MPKWLGREAPLSDIDIQFPAWVYPFVILIYAFWPLTVAMAGTGIWLYVARTSRAARIAAIVAAILWSASAGLNLYFRVSDARAHAAGDAYTNAHQRTLASDAVVSGMHLPAGTVVVTDDDFHLASLQLSKPALLFGVPLQGTVGLHDGALDGSQTLQRDATIDGLPCAADSDVSFAGGRLSSCRLSHATTIRGVPCGGYVNVGDAFLGCEVAQAYRRYGTTWNEGTDVRGNDGELTFTIGPHGSSLRVYGSSLPQGSMVVYRNGAIAMITPGAPLHYRGCALTHIERRNGAMTADVDGPCSLPSLPNGRVTVPNV